MVTCDMSQKELDHMIEKLQMEYIDMIPGCLLDNLMLSSKTLLVMVTEQYMNCWSSCYHVSIGETDEEDRQLWNKWNRLKEI